MPRAAANAGAARQQVSFHRPAADVHALEVRGSLLLLLHRPDVYRLFVRGRKNPTFAACISGRTTSSTAALGIIDRPMAGGTQCAPDECSCPRDTIVGIDADCFRGPHVASRRVLPNVSDLSPDFPRSSRAPHVCTNQTPTPRSLLLFLLLRPSGSWRRWFRDARCPTTAGSSKPLCGGLSTRPGGGIRRLCGSCGPTGERGCSFTRKW